MLVKPNSIRSHAKQEAGGKGYKLHLMSRLGLPVPTWACLGRRYFTDFLAQEGLEAKIKVEVDAFVAEKISAAQASLRIEELIVGAPLTQGARMGVREALELIGPEKRVSVRSSAADEDGSSHSFAGQLSSYLYVEGAADVERCLKLCWASAFSERAFIYRKERGLEFGKIGIAVVIQEMIDPDTSGVMFTCDPVAQKGDTYVVSAVYGVGEGLVSGALDADSYWLAAEDGRVKDAQIAEKSEAFRRAKSGEVEAQPVSEPKRHVPALGELELRALHELGRVLQQALSSPQDVEWAIQGGKLYVLQTRPVTTLESDLTGYPNLWDNSNIIESYGGLTSPLSFSFALRNYRNVYVQFCEILHVPYDVIKDMDDYLGNMLGCIDGRVYYNLYNWYKLVGILPGFKQNREFMETMMGVSEALSSEIAERIRPHASWDTWIGSWRKFKTGVKFLYYHLSIQGIVDDFLSWFGREYKSYRDIDYALMPTDRILRVYLRMEREMLGQWKAPIINDFLCMVHFGMLRKFTAKWLQGLDPNIQNDLIAGEGNLESAEPMRVLIRMAGQVAKNPPLRELIESGPSDVLMERLNQSSFRDFYTEVESYIERFGFRCMNEMKLEERDLYTDPAYLFVCLRNYLRSGTVDLAAYERREKELRTKAEERVRGYLGEFKRMIYFWSLKHARKAVKNRENTRFARTRIYGVARSMFQAMGEDLMGRGVLTKPDDIFWLTIEEIFGIHQGTLSAYDLPRLTQSRREAYARFEQEAEPRPRFQTRGPVYWANDYRVKPSASVREEGADYDLKGLPCCPGVIEGVVKVVMSPKDDLQLSGEILVAARTDPGWVPLYPSISGLLVERGSLLSHSAIVAREMGIPAIVAVPGLLQTLKSGMRIRLDGQAGTIKILEG